MTRKIILFSIKLTNGKFSSLYTTSLQFSTLNCHHIQPVARFDISMRQLDLYQTRIYVYLLKVFWMNHPCTPTQVCAKISQRVWLLFNSVTCLKFEMLSRKSWSMFLSPPFLCWLSVSVILEVEQRSLAAYWTMSVKEHFFSATQNVAPFDFIFCI